MSSGSCQETVTEAFPTSVEVIDGEEGATGGPNTLTKFAPGLDWPAEKAVPSVEKVGPTLSSRPTPTRSAPTWFQEAPSQPKMRTRPSLFQVIPVSASGS